jgi:hypothetical protein
LKLLLLPLLLLMLPLLLPLLLLMLPLLLPLLLLTLPLLLPLLLPSKLHGSKKAGPRVGFFIALSVATDLNTATK